MRMRRKFNNYIVKETSVLKGFKITQTKEMTIIAQEGVHELEIIKKLYRNGELKQFKLEWEDVEHLETLEELNHLIDATAPTFEIVGTVAYGEVVNTMDAKMFKQLFDARLAFYNYEDAGSEEVRNSIFVQAYEDAKEFEEKFENGFLTIEDFEEERKNLILNMSDEVLHKLAHAYTKELEKEYETLDDKTMIDVGNKAWELALADEKKYNNGFLSDDEIAEKIKNVGWAGGRPYDK